MRWYLMLVLMFMAVTANAGTLEICGRKETSEAGLSSCIEAQRRRATNLLRNLNATVLQVVNRQTQESGNKTKLREYQVFQTLHVREVATTCRKLAEENQRAACEADMTYAHMENLHRFLR